MRSAHQFWSMARQVSRELPASHPPEKRRQKISVWISRKSLDGSEFMTRDSTNDDLRQPLLPQVIAFPPEDSPPVTRPTRNPRRLPPLSLQPALGKDIYLIHHLGLPIRQRLQSAIRWLWSLQQVLFLRAWEHWSSPPSPISCILNSHSQSITQSCKRPDRHTPQEDMIKTRSIWSQMPSCFKKYSQ